MARGYRLEVAAPKTAVAGSKTWTFAPSTGDYPGRLISLDVSLKKDKRAVSHLTATLHDPAWEIFGKLPDPAFSDVPVRFYLESASDSQSPPRLVFDGVLTRMEIGYPGPTQLQVTAHDRSINMRKEQTQALKQFRNKTSVQIATEIIDRYGYQVVTDLGSIVPKVRKSHVAVPPSGSGWFSDWDVAASVLDNDGLEMFMQGETVTIRELATALYPTQYARGDSRIIRFNVQITHVATPGKGGDFIVLQNSGTVRALEYAIGTDATKQLIAAARKGDKAALAKLNEVAGTLRKASQATHREPVRGPTTEDGGSAASEIGGNPFKAVAKSRTRRKDKATLELHATADIGLQHIIRMTGFGGKADGEWEIEQVTHRLLGQSPVTTSIEMHRGISKGAATQIIPFSTAAT